MVFDSWYGSLENLKLIRGVGWTWLTRLKANRLVNPDRSGLRPVARVDTDARGAIVHLKGYGLIRLFKIVAPILTRDSILDVLGEVTVAPLTSTIRQIPSEVVLTPDDGVPQRCAVNLDHVQTVAKAKVGPFIAALSDAHMDRVQSALLFALGFER